MILLTEYHAKLLDTLRIVMIGFTKLSDTYSKTSTWTNVMYVKATDGENTGYSYMQNDISGEKLGNYYFVSYDSIVNSLS